jgi:hypothetical protein
LNAALISIATTSWSGQHLGPARPNHSQDNVGGGDLGVDNLEEVVTFTASGPRVERRSAAMDV